MYAELLTEAAADVARGGVVAHVLSGHEDAPERAALALRLLGAVHRLVLEGRVPELAVYYPSVGGTADPLKAWPVFHRVLETHEAEIRARLDAPPQTNEVGRSAPLLGGLLRIAAETRLPVRLLEIGTSAGLNLRFDHFRYDLGSRVYGPAVSPVLLSPAWTNSGPPLDAPLEVAERIGCDPMPIDGASPEGRLGLLSYVWPDQPDRIARLRGACEVAERVPATLVRAGGADFLADLAPAEGVVTVVWHSIMRQYVTPAEWRTIEGSLSRAGEAATPRAPVAHLAFEPRRDDDGVVIFEVTLRLWPGGEPRVIGTAPPHGLPVTWN
ncbi:DUF2332 domain-containing protein [Bailinhaonella thermotolerans]|uniref:DUF2332 domain-containing protein n=2 Tax=Bailinhaonella thermotolerans TaxID=1070861 RepID=A0A3A4B835_9ACTN|nr:DUF2332 domain-containing protein [Bailinhaonella thermotolerans]